MPVCDQYCFVMSSSTRIVNLELCVFDAQFNVSYSFFPLKNSLHLSRCRKVNIPYNAAWHFETSGGMLTEHFKTSGGVSVAQS